MASLSFRLSDNFTSGIQEHYNLGYNYKNEKLLIGTNLGGLLLLNIEENKRDNDNVNPTKIIDLNSEIRAIEKLNEEEVIILTKIRSLYVYNFETKEIKQINNENKNDNPSVDRHTWRLLVLNQNFFLTVGNYGKIILWNLSQNKEIISRKIILAPHNNAIFCLEWFDRDNNLIIMNDYKGLTSIWKWDGNFSIWLVKLFETDENLQKIKKLTFIDEKNLYIAVDYFGSIFLYEIDEDYKFIKIEDYNLSYSRGNSILVTENYALIGTNDTLVKLDESLRVSLIDDERVKEIFYVNGSIYYLTNNSLKKLDVESFSIPDSLVKFRYVNIGLVGDTRVGKSTFCNYIINGEYIEQESTLGTRIWRKTLNSNINNSIEKRIYYFDLAGQQNEIFIYFPILEKCNIILIFFSKANTTSFDNAINYYKELKELYPNKKYLFIKTFDDETGRGGNFYFKEKLEGIGIDLENDLIEISSKKGTGFDKYEEKLNQIINWNDVNIITKYGLYDAIEGILDELYGKNNEQEILNIYFDDFINIYLNSKVKPKRKIKNALLKLSDEFKIDFILSLNEILINDQLFETIKTMIATLITKIYKGIVSLDELTNSIFTELKNEKEIIINKCPKRHKKKVEEYINNRERIEAYIDHIISKFYDYGKNKNRSGIVYKINNSNDIKIIVPRKQFLKEKINFEVNDTFLCQEFNYILSNNDENLDIDIKELLVFLSNEGLSLIDISKNEILLKDDLDINFLITMDQLDDNEEIIKICKEDSYIFKTISTYSKIIDFIFNKIKNDILDVEQKYIVSDNNLNLFLDDLTTLEFILKNPFESPYLDFKKEININKDKKKSEFLVDVISLANSAYLNPREKNVAYLVIGLKEEKENYKLSFSGVNKDKKLEDKINEALKIYLNYSPAIKLIYYNLSEIIKICKKLNVDIISLPKGEIDDMEDLFLLVIKIIREEKIVYEFNRNITKFDVGDSWYRILSHNNRITERMRQILRNK